MALRPDEAGAGRRVTAPADGPDGDSFEAALLTLWQQALNEPGLSADDDFFASGGDSLMAIRVLARVRRIVDRPELTLPYMLKYPSAAAFAQFVRTLTAAAPDVAREPDAGLP